MVSWAVVDFNLIHTHTHTHMHTGCIMTKTVAGIQTPPILKWLHQDLATSQLSSTSTRLTVRIRKEFNTITFLSTTLSKEGTRKEMTYVLLLTTGGLHLVCSHRTVCTSRCASTKVYKVGPLIKDALRRANSLSIKYTFQCTKLDFPICCYYTLLYHWYRRNSIPRRSQLYRLINCVLWIQLYRPLQVTCQRK